MRVDALVAEIGSTTTVVNVFTNLRSGTPRFLGQGVSETTVLEGDVNRGLEAAIADAEKTLGSSFTWDEMFATSSAAGGLRMTVHGLVYDMTVRAAREAALGSGAVLVGITAGKLTEEDLSSIREAAPKMVLVAGGVDYGEKETALFNVKKLLPLLDDIPLVYAGNVENQREIGRLATDAGVEVRFAENVYPSIDQLNVLPTRQAVQEVFEKHIVHAPGMASIRELVDGPIMPTPGAVMAAAELVYDLFGDTIVFDVGGATTDVHSVTEGSEEMRKIQTAPEPFAKRTVEGDLGVFINRRHVLDAMRDDERKKRFGEKENELFAIGPIPQSESDIRLVEALAANCLEIALTRHAGRLEERFLPGGRIYTAVGRDLTSIKAIVGTGGPLSRLPSRGKLLADLRRPAGGKFLSPPEDAAVFIDRDYIMASLGVLAVRYPEAASSLLRETLTKGE